MKSELYWMCLTVFVLSGFVNTEAAEMSLEPKEELGERIFFDKQLSINKNQACAVCHGPKVGWTGPEKKINSAGGVYEGWIKGRFGNRKPPSSAYATQSPILDLVNLGGELLFVGGNFWDGRATGHKLGNPAADQAQGPFLNPVEQALPDSACVVYRVCTSRKTGRLFEQVWPGACDIAWPEKNIVEKTCSTAGGIVALSAEERVKSDQAYGSIALSIAAFEGSKESNQFSSKFDASLAGNVTLSAEEQTGLELFSGKAMCANCHVLDRAPNGDPTVLTDFTYDNIGVPRNPENPWYEQPFNPDGRDWVDLGLGGFLATTPTDPVNSVARALPSSKAGGRLAGTPTNQLPDWSSLAGENNGKHKVPTLRNVDKRPGKNFIKAYMHNGYFKSLETVVNFYNTRDVKDECADSFTTEKEALAMDCWPVPEVVGTVNTDEMGDLELSAQEEAAIVAFLKTLSDGFKR